MIDVIDLSLSFGGQKLFSDVNLSFTSGNCYGVIGANGAGKSTFLKILEGKIEPDSGVISIKPNTRMSILEQDHFKFEDEKVIDVVIMGNSRLMEIIKEKEFLYSKEDFTQEDGILASNLEAEFSEMDGWSAEANASSILQGLSISTDLHQKKMKELKGKEKVKVLLAKALFGNPDILILDEPTNDLDIKSILWLEDFLTDYKGTVIVVSHDRYFLNNICTHMVDIDYKKIKIFVGNYDFWYESSELMTRLLKEQNKKKEEKIKELKNFIARFSANKSKSKQATSRKKLLEKIELSDLSPSSRRYPFVGFEMEREVGNQILEVDGLSKTIDGKKILDNISFIVNKNEKIAFIGDEIAITTLFKILNGEILQDSGSFKFGVTTSVSYFPKDNSEFFKNVDLNLIDWLRQFSKEQSEIYIRGFLGKMLFSSDEALKRVKNLSGGEKVRMMLSYMMLKNSNILILDQPTNHLDLESITSLNNGLNAFKGNILFTSHDTEFVNTIANRIIHIENGTFKSCLMTYQEYIDNYIAKEEK